MRKRIIPLLLSLILLLQSLNIQIYAASITSFVDFDVQVKSETDEKTFTESAIFYSVKDSGDFTLLNIDVKPDGSLYQWKVYTKSGRNLGGGSGMPTGSIHFSGYDVYWIEIKGPSSTFKRISIDIKAYVPATTGTRYKTQTFVLTQISDTPYVGANYVGSRKYLLEISGGTELTSILRTEIASWYVNNNPKDFLIPRDGKTRELKGFGIIIVTTNGKIRGTYPVPPSTPPRYPLLGGVFAGYPNGLPDLLSTYGWSNATKENIKAAQEITLSYTSSYPAEAICRIFYADGTSETRSDEKIIVFPNTTVGAKVDATPKDAGWQLDTTKSKYWIGKVSEPLSMANGPNGKPLTEADIKKEFTLGNDGYSVLADYYYKKAELPKGVFGLDAKPDEGDLQVVDSSNLGGVVDLDINMKQPSEMLDTWDKVLDEPGVQASVSITRYPGAENISAVSSAFPANGVFTPSSKAAVMELLKGNNSLKFRDSTTLSYPIEPDETIEFTYAASVKIKVGAKEVQLTPDPGEDKVRFYRKKDPELNKGYYTSSPSYWSEIKEGSPLNEGFEAMAGVPTTRSLYFASGGSEFIVDAEVEYIPNGSAVRYYNDSYTAVTCDQNGTVTCPRPCGGHQEPDGTDSQGHTKYKTVYYNGDDCACPHLLHSEHNIHYVNDSFSWSQSSTFDYMRINNAKVWKLDKSKVDGMHTLLGTDEVTASVQSGDPNIFVNIASNDTSSSGRLRYSLNTEQHDNASWTQASNNSCTGHTAANLTTCNGHKNLTTNVTAISDVLILQTTRGDQSVMYFQKTSPTVRTTDPLAVPKTSKETMWDNNAGSAANWSEDAINIGSYNGRYQSPSTKYEPGGGPTVSTIFDTHPAGLNRPGRPGGGMRLVETGLDIIDTIPNREYITGTSTVFYRNILNHGPGGTRYSLSYNSDYGAYGQEFMSTYSPDHWKVNDIVIHNPVSTELAMIFPLSADRDQRSAGSAVGNAEQPDDKCPRNPADCEFRILDCHYSGGTSHTPACYTTIIDHGLYQTHVHTSSCTLVTDVTYLCNNLPLNSGGVGYWYHDSGCSYAGETHQTTSTTYCTTCGHSCGYLKSSPSPASHVHNASCPSYSTQRWSCNNLPLNSSSSNNVHVHTGACHHISTPLTYTCGNLPLNTGGSGTWYHSSGCSYAGETHTTTSNSSCTYCGHSCGYLLTAVSPATHTHTSSCGTIPAMDYWDCGGQPFNQHVCNANCVNTSVLNCVEPHHMGMHYDVGNTTCYRACMDDARHAAKTNISVPGFGTFTPGKFINLDYGFTLYFPNIGDFRGDNALGIGRTTAQRGKGYVDSMNTTEWTKEKSVYFDFNVILDGRLYRAGEKVPLDVDADTFDFYCPLGNHEWKDAKVRYECIAINSPEDQADNTKMTNRLRDWNLEARHSGIKNTTIDVVGRIGNFVIEDTGDFRFSNLFKQEKVPGGWLVPNVVPDINTSLQKQIIGDTYDIRGNPASEATCYLDTYGLQQHKRQIPVPFPLSPEKNNIPALQRQPLRPGYNIYSDIETIGDYYDRLQVTMYYYYLDPSGNIYPVDIYMDVSGRYKPINLHGAAAPGWNPDSIYNNEVNLAWEDEYLRRNYSIEEKLVTEQTAFTLGMNLPAGRYYIFGNSQILFPTERNRTFIGSTYTYEDDKNPDGRLDSLLYQQQAQRWNFTTGLPSSAVAVRKGLPVTQTNINALRNKNGVILATADILSIGKVFNLQYRFKEGNRPISIGGNFCSTSAIPYPIMAVYSADKSSADDLQITGTH